MMCSNSSDDTESMTDTMKPRTERSLWVMRSRRETTTSTILSGVLDGPPSKGLSGPHHDMTRQNNDDPDDDDDNDQR